MEDAEREALVRRARWLEQRLSAMQKTSADLLNHVLQQQGELRTLNKVVRRRNRTIKWLRTILDSVDALHFPVRDDDDRVCLECAEEWPCPTYVLLHPTKRKITQEDREED